MSRRERWIMTASLATGIGFSVVAGSAGYLDFDGASAQNSTTRSQQSAAIQDTSAQTQSDTVVGVVKQVSPAVVTVLNEQNVELQNGTESLQQVASGTGFIIDTDGHIVTNWHVVTGGSSFEVIFSDGTTRDAELVGSDQVSDLAVVKVEGDVPGVLPLGDSDALEIGETILAIGSPLGEYQNTVTSGIVSAVNRDFTDFVSGSSSQYNNLIQHDAAINPGNSGGPLVNLQGEVVGVNTLGISVNQSGQPIQGLFFAIPSNSVKLVAQALIADGQVVYPYVGIRFQDNSPVAAAQLDLDTDQGVIVTEVSPGGPADDAGLESGDIILQVGDYVLDGQTTFSEALFNYQPGDEIDLQINRDGEELTKTITLGERPQDI